MWLVDPEAIMPVPGFADAPVAVAFAKDGSKLVVDLHDPAAPRVAGLYQGPLGPAALVDDWMLLEGTTRTTILSRLEAG